MKSKLLDFAAFFLPILMLVKIKVVGYLFLGELFSIFILLFILKRIRFYWSADHTKLLLVFVLWTFSLIITDLVRGTEFVDYSRGWAKQLFIAANFLVFYMLFKVNPLRIYYVLFSLGVFYIYHGYRIFSDIPQIWKFGAGSGIALIVLSVVSNLSMIKKRKVFVISNTGLLLVFGVVSLLLNSRSLAGIFLLSSLAYYSLTVKKNYENHIAKEQNILKIILLGLVVIFSIFSAYDIGASSGWFGYEAERKYSSQHIDGYGPFGIILSGRTEFLVSYEAISESPIIGHGSWAKSEKYNDLLLELKDKFNRNYNYYSGHGNLSGLIPTHSHLLGAWVEGGILGAVFWLYVLILLFKLIRYWDYLPWRIQPILMFLIVWSSWDILFSPFGGERRLFWGVLLALLLFFLNKNIRMNVEQ